MVTKKSMLATLLLFTSLQAFSSGGSKAESRFLHLFASWGANYLGTAVFMGGLGVAGYQNKWSKQTVIPAALGAAAAVGSSLGMGLVSPQSAFFKQAYMLGCASFVAGSVSAFAKKSKQADESEKQDESVLSLSSKVILVGGIIAVIANQISQNM